MKLLKFFLVALAGIIVTNGCNVGTERVVPRGVRMQLQSDVLNKQIATQQDTIQLEAFKLLMDEFLLKEQSGNQLQSQLDAIELVYTENDMGSPKILVQGNIPYDDFDEFTGVEVKISPPDSGDTLNDPDFRNGDEDYSFILKGQYNGEAFTYKSDYTNDKLFEFDPLVVLTNSRPVIELRISFDPEDFLFDNEEGSIIDPNNSANSAKIDSLMFENLIIEAEKVDTN